MNDRDQVLKLLEGVWFRAQEHDPVIGRVDREFLTTVADIIEEIIQKAAEGGVL